MNVDVEIGVTQASGEDRFVRTGPYSAVDLFVYVGGSGSMSDDQRRLSDQAGTLITALGDSGVDWQVGVTGKTNGCIGTIVDEDSSDPEGEFEDAVLDIYGIHNERGLQTTAAAVSASGDTGCNAGFLREDAAFIAILVSDEPDQSWGGWSSRVKEILAISPLARISAIAGDYPGGCSTATAGTGYYQASVATDGLFLSICTADWSDHVEDLTSDLTSDPDAPYQLSMYPDPDTIEVFVEDLARTDWSWYSAMNAVIFDSAGAVLQGEEVVITYLAACPE